MTPVLPSPSHPEVPGAARAPQSAAGLSAGQPETMSSVNEWRLDRQLVQPSAFVAADLGIACLPWRGARTWRAEARSQTVHTILPDLSQDVVLVGSHALLLPRTVRATRVPLQPRTPVVGLRLPLAATYVQIDHGWHGWRSSLWGSAPHVDGWELAHREGAVAWSVDRELDAVVRELDIAGIKVSDVASRLFMSDRTLRRRCLEWFGVTPAYLRGTLRSWRFLRTVHDGSSASTAAAVAGYSDMAHASRHLSQFCDGRRWADFHLAE